MFSFVYEELRRIGSSIRRGDPAATINSTALVHEAWLKLKGSLNLAATSESHFKAIAAGAMRQILIDAARRRNARKRGGAGRVQFVTLDDSADYAPSSDAEMLVLNDALERLAVLSPRQARVVELRFFGGLGIKEAALSLGVSGSMVERDWRAARAWLALALRPGEEL